MKLIEVTNRGRNDLRFEQIVPWKLHIVAPGQTVKFESPDVYANNYLYLRNMYAVVRIKEVVKKPIKNNLNEIIVKEDPKPILEKEDPKPIEKVEEKVEVKEEPKKTPKKRKKISF